MLNATQLAALTSELTNDPLKIGYSAELNISDIAVAGMLNATTGNGAATITIPSLTHDEFATLIAPVVMAIGSASAALQAQWTPMLNLISGINVFQTTPQNMGMLNALSADFPNQLTASAITAATTRMGSRAEILFGIGTTIAWQDVAQALGR
jgi:hypothetical protein